MHALTRKIASPVLAVLTAGSIAFAGFSHTRPASADFTWCFDDPIISVGGHLVDVRVGQPLLDLLTVRSTTLTVVIPSNVAGSVVVNDLSAFPMKTTISRTGPAWSGSGAINVTVTADVTSSKSFTASMVATPVLSGLPASASGTTNKPFSLSLALK